MFYFEGPWQIFTRSSQDHERKGNHKICDYGTKCTRIDKPPEGIFSKKRCQNSDYANEKNRLNKQGTPIEDFDLLIASAAYVRNLKLVTDNLKHFKNVQGLVVENWVER